MHKSLRFALFTFIVIIGFNTAKAQAQSPVEVTAKCLSSNYYMLPIGEKGVLVFSENLEKQDPKAHYWNITRYDKEFKEVYNKELKVNFVVDFERYFLESEGKLHLLFTQHATAAYNTYVTDGYYQIFTINTDSGTIAMKDGKMQFKVAIQGFAVLGSTAFIGGKVVPAQSEINSLKALAYIGLGIPFLFNITYIPSSPVLVNVNLESGAVGLIDLKFDGSAEVSRIAVNPATQWADVSVSEFNTAEESKVYINSFDGATNFRGAQVLKAKGENLLTSSTLQTLSNDKQFMLGTFAIDPNKSKGKNNANKDNNADGFYIAKLGEVKPVFIQYINFSKIKNLVKAAQGNEMNYNIVFHNIIELSTGQLVLVAELYSATYNYEEKIVTDEKGNLKRSTVPALDKYQFAQVFACGLDKNNGKVLWSEVLDRDILNTTTVSERALVKVSEDKVGVLFPQKSGLHYKLLNSKNLADNREIGKFGINYFNESGEWNIRCDVQLWHNNVVYLSGFANPRIIAGQPKPAKPIFNFSKIELK